MDAHDKVREFLACVGCDVRGNREELLRLAEDRLVARYDHIDDRVYLSKLLAKIRAKEKKNVSYSTCA